MLRRSIRRERNRVPSFNIRSFGSWIASCSNPSALYASNMFQYPLFRIVDCFAVGSSVEQVARRVSISALSDRGLLQRMHRSDNRRFLVFQYPLFRIVDCFVFIVDCVTVPLLAKFQYPLFRIVDCFLTHCALETALNAFQYPLFRIVDCFQYNSVIQPRDRLFQYPLFRIVDCFLAFVNCTIRGNGRFNIRSFGSWIASVD